jgi:hypothetical protein
VLYFFASFLKKSTLVLLREIVTLTVSSFKANSSGEGRKMAFHMATLFIWLYQNSALHMTIFKIQVRKGILIHYSSFDPSSHFPRGLEIRGGDKCHIFSGHKHHPDLAAGDFGFVSGHHDLKDLGALVRRAVIFGSAEQARIVFFSQM